MLLSFNMSDPEISRNPAPGALHRITDLLRAAPTTQDKTGLSKRVECGSSRADAYELIGRTVGVSVSRRERQAYGASFRTFYLEIVDDEHGSSGTVAKATIWLGDDLWRLWGSVDRPTGDITWRDAILPQAAELGSDVSIKIAELDAKLAAGAVDEESDTALQTHLLELRNGVSTAIAEVDRQLVEAACELELPEEAQA